MVVMANVVVFQEGVAHALVGLQERPPFSEQQEKHLLVGQEVGPEEVQQHV